MSFASSRLTIAAVLVAGTALHGACGGSTDLNFVGAPSTAGGSGNPNGGSSNTSGSSSGGSGNGTSSGGTGNSSSGGTNPGTGGQIGAGGDTSQTEICNDGVDNDRNGLIDCPIFVRGFPDQGRAAAGSDVVYEFEESAIAGATYECRIGKPAEIDSLTWDACPNQDAADAEVLPFPEADAKDPSKDGLWVVEIRFKFPDGSVSDSYARRLYMHHSLYGVNLCPAQASDDEYFAAAAEYLPTAGTFGTAARLANPFIYLDFDPPVDAKIAVTETDGIVKPLSLRKRFVRSPDDEYVMMTRVYGSRSGKGHCNAGSLSVHLNQVLALGNNLRQEPACTAWVLNKKGAGVCLFAESGSITLARQNNTSYFVAPAYYPEADNLLWRELGRLNWHDRLTRYFSPKCFDSPECVDDHPEHTPLQPVWQLYLPDVAEFD